MLLQHLVDRPECIPSIAQWYHDEWSYAHPGSTVEWRIAELKQRVTRNELPLTLVGIDGDDILGTYSLDLEDMDTHHHLSPWLASVFVNPNFRRRGIGTLLVQDAMERAKVLGIRRLYLFTPDQAHWYAKMGWGVLEETFFCAKKVTVMVLDLHRG